MCIRDREHLHRITPTDPSTIQAGLLALDEKGDFGGFALQRGFNYVVALPDGEAEPNVKGEISDRVTVRGGMIYVVEAPYLMG